MKKILFIIIFLISIVPKNILASSITLVRVGNNYYDNLQDAIKNAKSNDIINLITNIEVEETLNINKNVNINLNGKTISAKEKVFLIEGGFLHLSGTGLIKETNPNYGAIMIKGSKNKNDINYSTLKADAGITLEGWSGIFIGHNNGLSYGILVNTEATIISKKDSNGITGAGIYINGTIKDDNNSPIININKKSIINSEGTGLYQAGYATTNIEETHITGEESAISIKSGILNIKSGTFTCTGSDNTPTNTNNNGINPSGATIQIESNNNYKGNIQLNITGGTLTSKNSHVIYEYTTKESVSKIVDIKISDGIYKSPKNIFSLSNSLVLNHQKFITGGRYNQNVEEYLSDNYSLSKIDDMYVVTKSVMKEELLKQARHSNILKFIIYFLIFVLLSLTIYLNKAKILKVIKFSKHN